MTHRQERTERATDDRRRPSSSHFPPEWRRRPPAPAERSCRVIPEKWGGVAGHVADDAGRDRSPRAAARAEIEEETGIGDADVSRPHRRAFPVDDSDRGDRWVVHPFLFDCESRAVETNVETSEYEWAVPSAILLRETVPALWSSYDRVRPRVATVRDDHEHGSASPRSGRWRSSATRQR